MVVTSQRRSSGYRYALSSLSLFLSLFLFIPPGFSSGSVEEREAEDQENSRERGKVSFPGGWCRRQIPFPPRSDSNREKTNAWPSSPWTWVCPDDGLLSSEPFPPSSSSVCSSTFALRCSGLRCFCRPRADARSLPRSFYDRRGKFEPAGKLLLLSAIVWLSSPSPRAWRNFAKMTGGINKRTIAIASRLVSTLSGWLLDSTDQSKV